MIAKIPRMVDTNTPSDTQPPTTASTPTTSTPVALDSVRAMCLYQVLDMDLRFGGAMLRISTQNALRNMGLIGRHQHASTKLVRHFHAELDRQLSAAGVEH